MIRGDGQVLYTIASVVDDTDMGITNVVRGSDHVTNTATQIQIMSALGHTAPGFAHHSLLTGPQGEALSKRLGTLSLRDLRAAGIEPMALLSHLARLGSSDPVELRSTHQELIDGFDLSRFGSAPTKFDVDDLRPLTARVLHGRSYADVADALSARGVSGPKAEPFWLMARENVEVIADVDPLWDIVQNGATPLVADEDAEFIADALANLPAQPWGDDSWSQWANTMKERSGRKGKALFMPLRKALSGMERGPDMGRLMPLLTKTPTLS